VVFRIGDLMRSKVYCS